MRILGVTFVMSVTLITGLSAGAIPRDSAAQEQSAVPLAVHSNVEGAKVYINGVFAGVTPLSGTKIAPGPHMLRVIHPDSTRWPVTVLNESLVIAPGIPMERTLNFPPVYHITSEPYGAEIIVGDSVIGTTPMYIAAFLGGREVRFSRRGFEEASLLCSDAGGEMNIFLRPSGIDGGSGSPLMVSGEQSKNLTPIIVSAGATVIAGSAAAYFKIKADRSYDEYLRSGSPGALTRVDNFDKYAAISLVVSQLSFFALSYLLLSK